MNDLSFWIYLAIIALSTYLIRTIPFAVVKRKIENPFIRSFLYYIPYTVLAAMTLPAALYATGNVLAAAIGLFVAVLFSIKGAGLTLVAAVSCMSVFISQWIMNLI